MRVWSILCALAVQFTLLILYFFLYGMAMWAARSPTSLEHVAALFLWVSDVFPVGMEWTNGGMRAPTESAAIVRSIQAGAVNAILVLAWLTPLLTGVWWVDRVTRQRREEHAARRSVAKFLGFAGSGAIIVMVTCILLGLHWQKRGMANELALLSSDMMKCATVLSVAWVVGACLTGVLPGGLTKKRAAGECPGCGYLRGELVVCPECGLAVVQKNEKSDGPRPRALRRRWVWLAFAGVVAAVMFPLWSDWLFEGMPRVLQAKVETAVNSVGRWKP